ncbi:hypothetical protein EDD15DRAFT_1877177 [Pisolithus albus]|nr:hypothetical protein EDD15DRAFT_1877177 [Pisolithus albus]
MAHVQLDIPSHQDWNAKEMMLGIYLWLCSSEPSSLNPWLQRRLVSLRASYKYMSFRRRSTLFRRLLQANHSNLLFVVLSYTTPEIADFCSLDILLTMVTVLLSCVAPFFLQ